MKKILLVVLLLICSSCASPYVSGRDKKLSIYPLEKTIEKKLSIKHGDIVLKYDLLELGNNYEHYCYISGLHGEIFTENHSKDKLKRLNKSLEDRLSKRLADINKSKKILIKNALNTKDRLEKYLSEAQGVASLASLSAKFSKQHDKLSSYTYTRPDRFSSKDIDILLSHVERLDNFISSYPSLKPLKEAIVTSNYGMRKDPFHKSSKFHSGIDLKAIRRYEVYATAKGKIVFAGKNGGYGNMVKIQHDNNIQTIYAHLDEILIKDGSIVEPLYIVGIEGASGRTTSEHLHYEILADGQPIDPKNFLKDCNVF